MISAKQLREKIDIENKLGYYKWWAQKEEFDILLEKLDINIDDIKNSLEIKDNLYCIYVGIAVNESVGDRLNWHINDKGRLFLALFLIIKQMRKVQMSLLINLKLNIFYLIIQ